LVMPESMSVERRRICFNTPRKKEWTEP
jgi:hypothetical protein